MSNRAYESLLALGGLDARGDGAVQIVGSDPWLDTPFRVGEVCAGVLAAHGAAYSNIWQLRGGTPQQAKVDVKAAAFATFGIGYQAQQGYPIALPEPDYPTVGLYPTRDERFILING